MEMERTSALSFGRLGRFGGRAIIAWFEGQQTRPEAWADPPFDHDRQTESRRYNQQRSEEHTSELQSLMRISYAVFCLKKKKNNNKHQNHQTELKTVVYKTTHITQNSTIT